MKILYIHQYFKTPSEAGGTRSYWIAKELIKNGHSVTMLTSSSSISSKMENRKVEGIDVIYFKIPYNQKMSIRKRLFSFLNFIIRSSIYALNIKNIDLVIATSTPLTVGVPAIMLKWFRRIPFLFEVRDLWPEVPIQMGALNNPIIRSLAIKLEKTIYYNAKHVIALSPGMQDGVLKYLPKERVSMIPNMSKIDVFWPRQKNELLIKKYNLGLDTFKIIHFGALGIANGVDRVLESAKLLKNNSSIKFIFIGGGSKEKELMEMCNKYNLCNVKFLGEFPLETTSELVNLCDVSIVSFKDLPILYTNSPNKLFDSLSAGKPIIVNSAGWTKNLVENNNCGYYVNPQNPQELVDKILFLIENPKIKYEMGLNSRKLAEKKYDKNILCAQFVDTLNKISN